MKFGGLLCLDTKFMIWAVENRRSRARLSRCCITASGERRGGGVMPRGARQLDLPFVSFRFA